MGQAKENNRGHGLWLCSNNLHRKKGKSSIKYIVGDGPIHSYFDVFIYDKNVEIFGVKYGMKKRCCIKETEKAR